uniref:Multidrug and toxin extrusion protein n=1 Tax=Takifugu rubripes TaxID=31033 RepID=A0A674NJN3_TAKRU
MDASGEKFTEAKENGAVRGSSDPEAAGGCCSCPAGKRLVPPEYRNELRHLFKLAGPVVISQTMTFMISFVSTIFCGHLGKTELAGVSLSIAVVNVTGVSIGTGLSLTCDTLISQTYGSGNLKRVGVILQRGVLILLLACFPCWAVLINTEALLLAAQQSPEVARSSDSFALQAAFMYQLQGRYLQNQGIIWPQVVTGAIANLCNAGINYLLLFHLELGVAGSAAANAISQFIQALVLFIYICVMGLHKATWDGWSLECLQEWGPFVRLAIPSMLMLCLEWWLFEVGAFLAGLISEADLGAQSITYELTVIAYMVPMGLSAAASVRVGNALGAGKPEQAKLSCIVPVVCTCKKQQATQTDTSIKCFGAGVTGGVLRGAGKQMVGALCNLVGHYFIGLPIGVSLMFAAHMGIIGLWTGLTVCVFMQASFFVIYLCRLDWQKASKEVSHVAVFAVYLKVNVAKLFLRWSSPGPGESGDPGQRGKGDDGLGRYGKFRLMSVPVLWVLSSHVLPGPARRHTDVSTVDAACKDLEGASAAAAQTERNVTTTTTVGDLLSGTQLVLRRGSALLVMLAIMAAGILLSHFLTPLLK